MAGQLVLPFGVQPAFKRETFISAPCNEAALAFVQRWPDWPQKAAALYGPQGSGKSHLAAIWAGISNAGIISACDLTPESLDIPNGPTAFVVEDFDQAPPNALRDQALLGLYDRPGTWLLLTGRAAPQEWPVAVADLSSRLTSLIALPVWAPDDSLLGGLVRKHFADRQLEVPDAVIRRIITHVERTPAAVASFVAHADAKALAEKRAINSRLIVELLDAGGADPQTG